MRSMDKKMKEKDYEDLFLDEADKLRFSIVDEIYRPVFPLKDRLSEDNTTIIPESKDIYDCYCYWLKFLLLRPLAPLYQELKIERLGPKSLALLTTYVSQKLQEEIKKQINDGLLKKLVLGFVDDEDIKKTLAQDSGIK